MALEQRLNLRLSQKLIMTPSLQQAIKLLQLSRLELVNEINQELVANPVLEEGQETMAPEQLAAQPQPDKGKIEEESRQDGGTGDDDDYDAFWRDYLDKGYEPRHQGEPMEGPSYEATLSKQENLTDHLTWQLEMTPIDDRRREIAEAIIGNLNADGYLDATIEELQAMGSDGGGAYTEEEVRAALAIVQSFDPAGVAARDLGECLALQIRHVGLSGTRAERIVREHLDKMRSHDYQGIATALSCDLSGVLEDVEVIKHLDPSPGLKYNSPRSHYVTPDAYVVKDEDGEYKVTLNEDGLPRLRISHTYRRMLEQGASAADAEAKEFVREKFRSAIRLIKSLDERQRTIMKVAVSLVKHQRDFLDFGLERIRPLRLRDVADDIQMHESTVSRVVRNKYLFTPRGLFEMRYFFHAGVPDDRGGEVSSLSVKQKIKEIVDGEDSGQPLSDAAIVKILERNYGVKVARRTVAKYRGELRILSSSERKVTIS